MTIDEAISHALEVAGEQQERADSAELIDILDGLDVEACKECAAEHRQLAEWLNELKEAKQLLKAAVDGYRFIGHITKDYACPSAASCSACPMDEGKQCRIWEHADEALALIGEEGDTNG